MILDVSKDSQSHGGSQVAKGPTNTRKRKRSLTAPHEGAKRRTLTRERPDPAEQRSGESSSSADPPRKYEDKYYDFTVRHRPLNQLGANRQWQCNRCDESEETCQVEPLGPCRRCKRRKQGCSLMPKNKKTKKTNRRKMTLNELLEFRTDELEKRRAKEAEEAEKGKGCVYSLPATSEPEASVSAPSPSEPLTGLGALAVESAGSSSAVNTHADSPATGPPLPERPAPAPLKVSKTRRSTRRSVSKSTFKPPAKASAQHLTAFALEVPCPRQVFNRTPRRASLSPSGASPTSGDASNAARFAAIQRRLDALEKLVQRASPPPSGASPASGDTSNAVRFTAIERRLDALKKSVHAQIPS